MGYYPRAALANGTAVRELDYHDTFLAAEYSHPGANIPPLTCGIGSYKAPAAEKTQMCFITQMASAAAPAPSARIAPKPSAILAQSLICAASMPCNPPSPMVYGAE